MNGSINTTKNIYKTFAKYVSFNILSMIGLSCYILADTMFVANGLGSSGLAALNLVLPIYSFISGIGLMLGMGAATRYSILRGKNKIDKANKVFSQAMLLGTIIGLILTIIGVFFSYKIASLLGADETTLQMAGKYLQTILLFSCAFILNNILVCFVRNDNSPNLSMMAMLLGSFSNIILDYIFIFPLGLGMFGAAFATGLAPIVSMLVLSLHWIKKKNNFKFVKSNLEIKLIKNIISLGLPSFITEFSSGIIMLFFNFTILKISGNIGIAAYGIIANIALIVVAIFTGIAQGIQPIISTNFGSNKINNIKKVYVSALILAIILGSIFYLIGVLYPDNIISIFNSEKNTLLLEMATEGISLYFIAFFIMGINIVTTALFSAMAKPVESFLISIIRGCIAVIPLILVLPQFLQMRGIWITIPSAELITFIICIICLKKGFKKAQSL